MKAEDAFFQDLALAAKRRTVNKLDYYEPYPFQVRFHNAIGKGTTRPAVHKALMAANQVGKSFCGGMDVAIHATGLYPDWWKGHRFERGYSMLCAGMTNDSTRDICQGELFGDPADPQKFGTGAIPKHLIGKQTRKAGVPNAFDSVYVKHKSGDWSKIFFRSYEQGWQKFMGIKFYLGWLDEEPPEDIWSQFIRATLSTKGYLNLTFTPEQGVTKVVHQFMSDLKNGQALIGATWDDAPHMTGERREQALQAMPSHQREMRSKGVPLMGSGLVFQVPEEQIKIAEVKLADWWPRIAAIDFGMEHHFACVWLAWDRDTDTVYVYDIYAETGKSIPENASAMRRHGDWIPIIWPHDGAMRDKGRPGKQIADLYRDEKANMLPFHFTNPPAPGQQEGQGGITVEDGIEDMLLRMQTGRFKVLAHLTKFFEEYRMYHRKDGQIVKQNDDIMSATRYGVRSLRHAITKPVARKRTGLAVGVTNW